MNGDSASKGAAEDSKQSVLCRVNLPTFTAGICLLGISGGAWLVAWLLSSDMNLIGSICSGAAADTIVPTPLVAAHIASMLAMWTAMAVAMMIPVGAPAILAQLHTLRSSALSRQFTFVAFSTVGYLTIWLLTAAPFALAQWGLEAAQPSSVMSATASPGLALALLIGAGCYQFTPLKRACLNRCTAHAWSTPAAAGLGAVTWGLGYGLNCVGSCWALMALMFVGGMTNVAWSAALCALMIAERIWSSQRRAELGRSGVEATGLVSVAGHASGWMHRRDEL